MGWCKKISTLLVLLLAVLVGEQLWRISQPFPLGLPLPPVRPKDFPHVHPSLDLSPSLRDKTAVVSGASGFFGSVLTEQLLLDGWTVVGLHRRGSPLGLLKSWQSSYPETDLSDVHSLFNAVPQNISVFFHVASSMAAWAGQNDLLYKINVEGSRNVVQVARERNVQKIVATAGLGTYWCPRSDECKETISESSPKRAAHSFIGYTYTKYLQEDVFLAGIEEGQWVTMLNPVNMIGPYDRNSYGRLYKAVKKGEFPVVTPAKHNFASAINIAKAHINAAKVGVLGQNYLLGGKTASIEEFAGHICDEFNTTKPTVVPSSILFPFAIIGDIIGKYLLHKDPEFTLEVWYMFLNDKTSVPFVDSSKAVKELGYEPEFDFGASVRAAARWTLDQGQ